MHAAILSLLLIATSTLAGVDAAVPQITIPVPLNLSIEQYRYTGLIADLFCIERRTALDGADMLLAPEGHTLHCLVDIDQCWRTSVYCLMNNDADNMKEWGCAYTFNQTETLAFRDHFMVDRVERANLEVEVFGAWDPVTERLIVNTSATRFLHPPGSLLQVTLGLVFAVVTTLIVGIIGGILNYKDVQFTVGTRRILTIAVVSLFVGLLLMVVLTGYFGHLSMGVPVPFARGLGTTMLFLFFLILLPTTKHFGVGHIIGVSYEEFIKFHVLVGLSLWVVMSVHGILMFNTFASVEPNGGFLFRFSGSKKPNGAGFVAWVLLTLMVVTALVRQWVYTSFRVTHTLFILVLLFAIWHHVFTAIFVVIPLLVYIAEFVYRVVRTEKADPVVIDVRGSNAARATHIAMRLGAGVSLLPWGTLGQFVLLRLRALGVVEQHPFTLAWYDASTREAHVIIRANSEKVWTGKLLAHATSPAVTNAKNHGLGVVSWTGPFGNLRVGLGSVDRALVVAGGIGVTLMTNMLSAVLQAPDGAVSRLKLLRCVWIVREAALVELVAPLLQRAGDLLESTKTTADQRRVEVRIFVTGGSAPTEMKDIPAESKEDSARKTGLPSFVTMASGRPDMNALAMEVSGEDSSSGRAALYSCGPGRMLESAEAAAAQSGMLYDEQAFSIGQ